MQIFTNHSVLTKDFVKVIKGVGEFLYFALFTILLTLTGILWFISLGHIIVVKSINKYMENVKDR